MFEVMVLSVSIQQAQFQPSDTEETGHKEQKTSLQKLDLEMSGWR